MSIRAFRGIHPRIGERCYIDASADVMGNVMIGTDSSVWPQCVVRGDVNRIRIGARTNIQDSTVIHVTHDGPYTPDGGIMTIVGDEVTVGHKALLHACEVNDRCLIGMGAILMDGVFVEEEVMVAAGSLVPPGKRLLSRKLYRGSPAVEVRDLTDKEIEMLEYSAAHYVRLKDAYLGN
jgi:carbonic anhydrase/acetyltransferase-like protein (isoleucine patch superfamily)